MSTTVLLILTMHILAYTQTDTIQSVTSNPVPHWFESINVRGYTQVRYNRLLETNDQLRCEQCDRSWGNNGGFFLRRIRIIFFGQINKNVFFYIQPDFASNASPDQLHYSQIRDAYFDIGIDKDNEFRFRLGQSKVPFGFENMQSSQNRIPLDRNDAINSPLSNERDIGVFFYWAPKEKRKLLSRLVSSGLKGSGDYGIFAFGVYNGQLANSPELNNSPHMVSRITYPFEYKNQIIEMSLQGYTGQYVLSSSRVSPGVTVNPDFSYLDQRIASSFILYPKPFGFQAEYNIGKGPEYDPLSNSILSSNLKGGYAMASYMLRFDEQVLIPFVRYHNYDGGKKHERDARSYSVREAEIGFEWQLHKNFELVMHYTISRRRFEDAILPNNLQRGNLLRIQAQVNY